MAQGRYYLKSNYPPLLPHSLFLSIVLSMKRALVMKLEQRDDGLHGPGAHYVGNNRLEARTCFDYVMS